jgi:hypothetical protein
MLRSSELGRTLVSYAVSYWATLHPLELCCTLLSWVAPIWDITHPPKQAVHYCATPHATELHRKKRFRGFPFPSREVTYETLSRREYVSLIKPEIFPFPSWNSRSILLNQLVFLFAGRSFPGYSSSPGGNSSKIFVKSFVYLFPAWNFHVFSPFSQSSLIYIYCLWVNNIHIWSITMWPS